MALRTACEQLPDCLLGHGVVKAWGTGMAVGVRGLEVGGVMGEGTAAGHWRGWEEGEGQYGGLRQV